MYTVKAILTFDVKMFAEYKTFGLSVQFIQVPLLRGNAFVTMTMKRGLNYCPLQTKNSI